MGQQTAPEVAVVGSANLDFIMKADRLPRVGETVSNAVFSQAAGGKGANQAVAAARSWSGSALHTPARGHVGFVVSIGSDESGTAMTAAWEQSGIDTRHVSRVEGHTGCASIMIGEGGRNMIVAAPEANDLLLPDRIDEAADILRGVRYILMQFEIPESTTERILKFAGDARIPVIWNVAPMRSVRRDLLALASVIVVNETEAELITGTKVQDADSAEDAGRLIVGSGPETAIVTLGASGSLVTTADGAEMTPAFDVEAVDSTAAGDTFCGCLLTALAEGRDLTDAVRFASAGAALSVGRLGAQPSIPWRNEIDEFLTARSGPGPGHPKA